MTLSFKNTIILGTGIVLILSLFLFPNGDDWYYVTQPTLNGLVDTFLIPDAGKWRPLDGLWGWFLYQFPFLYPYMNHIIVVVLHGLTVWILFKIISQINPKYPLSSKVFSLMFFLHPNVFSTVFSIDSINQVGTVCFGLLGVYFGIREKRGSWLIAFVFCWISVLFKESGFGFFLLIPLIYLLKDNPDWEILLKKRKSYIAMSIGLTGFFLYLLITFGIDFFQNFESRSSGLNANMSSSYYNPTFGTAALLGRFLPFNLPALMNPGVWLGWFVIPLIFGVYWVFQFVFRIFKYFNLKPLNILLIIFTFSYAIIHASMNGITEMNSYTLIAFICLWAGINWKIDYLSKWIYISFISSSLFIWGFKYSTLIKCDIATDRLVNSIINQEKRNPKRVLAVLLDNQSYGHDIYQPYAAISSGGGIAISQVKQFQNIEIDQFSIQVEAPQKELVMQLGVYTKLDKNNWENELQSLILKKKEEYNAIWVIAQDSLYGVF